MDIDKVFSEVYAILAVIDNQYVQKTPMDILQTIKDKRDTAYTPDIDANKPLDEQGLSEDAIVFIFTLKRDYWCETEEERAAVTAIFAQNKEKWESRLAGAGNTRAMLKMLHKK
jgi:hypothetical protein